MLCRLDFGWRTDKSEPFFITIVVFFPIICIFIMMNFYDNHTWRRILDHDTMVWWSLAVLLTQTILDDVIVVPIQIRYRIIKSYISIEVMFSKITIMNNIVYYYYYLKVCRYIDHKYFILLLNNNEIEKLKNITNR